VLPISGLPVGWLLIVLLISGVFAARPEIVFRAEKQDLPAIAKALFERSSRK
jgi:hypothetical protein